MHHRPSADDASPPDATESPPDDPAADQTDGNESGEYEYTVREEAGELVRDYADVPQQQIRDWVETETADGGGTVEPSWGNCDVREVLEYLFKERLRGLVPLRGTKSCGVGCKISCDAALVRRAKRWQKHWTTVIVQVLCQGVDNAAWGTDAVVGQLQKAQSPNKFAKVRVWNGKDDRENVRPPAAPPGPPRLPT